MELTCDDPLVAPKKKQAVLSVEAKEFQPKRQEAAATRHIKNIIKEEELEH